MYKGTNAGRALFRRSGRSRSPLCAPQRAASTSAAPVRSKNNADSRYQDTLLLPRPSIPQWFDAREQAERYGPRTTEELYRWQWRERKGKELFVLHDGPPYANGNLHNGHAVNKILKDIINRFQMLQGKRVNYIPGWDCHGLPIENKVLKTLNAAPNTLPPSEIRAASRQLASEEITIQREEFKKMQIMADWSEETTYRTYDREYEIRQLRLFQRMVGKGLINRRFRPIWWSPASRTALAEGELQYEDAHQTKSVYVKFPVRRDEMSEALGRAADALGLPKLSLLVWTTTAWTLPANMAVAINSDIDYVIARNNEHTIVVGADAVKSLPQSLGEFEVLHTIAGSDLLGTRYHHFFQPPSAPPNSVFPAPYVKSDSGTGLVHSAPGHGAEDYFTLRASGALQDRDILSPVDGEGCYTAEILKLVPDEATGQRLLGKRVQVEGGNEVLQLLRDARASIAVKSIKHRYPYDWKTKTPVITRATSQWFANIDDVKEAALKVLADVKFYPEGARARLEAFVRERSEWCISRQRTWGVPIPALHDVETDEAYLMVESLDHIIGVLAEKGVAYWWDGPVQEFISPGLEGKKLRKGTDTMDVWFDSGTSWSMLGNLHGEEQQGGPVTADVCIEGSDQHRGWFQSLLLTRIISAPQGQEKAPFKSLITHGFVMDEKGRKMSKSDGNVISPITTIEGGQNLKKEPAYGADVLRLWTAASNYSSDMAMGPVILKQASESLRKLRNTARFMLGVIGDADKETEPVPSEEIGLFEQYLMDQLYHLERNCHQAYASFQFHRVVHALTDFSTTQLSSLYFDITKDCLYADPIDSRQRRAIITVCKEILRVYKSLLAPVAPLLTEEIHEAWNPGATASVFMEPWPTANPEWIKDKARKDMEILLQIRSAVLILLEKARNDKKVRSALGAVVHIQPKAAAVVPDQLSIRPVLQVLTEHVHLLKTLFITSDATIGVREHAGNEDWVYSDEINVQGEALTISVLPSPREKCPRCWKFTKPTPEAELCDRCVETIGHAHGRR
ncbi:isoleucyl-tRNA synthetase [Calocera viscosa TUFC12733]|uniref:isoleucine--tRNA ligase n=1 Tax=Calocera viscosa (strain TUFC12733) TaxID=1330018 RepID=A0A167P9Z2_CALVF|nr:isoleucyl-tRNA synthetase [Calocera viscosa TUFC12733]